DENRDQLPYFGALDLASGATEPFVFEDLAPYVMKKTTALTAADNEVKKGAIRKCPGGSFGPEPPNGGTAATNWNCWIGCNFGIYSTPLTVPFYYHWVGSIG